MSLKSKVSMTLAVAGLCFTTSGMLPLHAAASPVAMYGQEPWETPPAEFDEVSRLGFHDGVEGARKDFGNHRSPDPHNRDEFRHPHVKGRDKEAYRRGFERGYQVGWDHITHER